MDSCYQTACGCGTLPPAYQPEDVHGRSEVIDPATKMSLSRSWRRWRSKRVRYPNAPKRLQRARRSGRPRVDVDVKRLRALQEQGSSLRQIAAKTKLSLSTVARSIARPPLAMRRYSATLEMSDSCNVPENCGTSFRISESLTTEIGYTVAILNRGCRERKCY